QVAEIATVQLQHVGAVELHLTRRRFDEAQDQATRGRLAAARLADESERLPLRHRERHARHSLHRTDLAAEEAGLDRELLHDVAARGERLPHRRHDASLASSTAAYRSLRVGAK